MHKYILSIKENYPRLFMGENPVLKIDSIEEIYGLNDLRSKLLDGRFSILNDYPRTKERVEHIMDKKLKWEGPDLYIAYSTDSNRITQDKYNIDIFFSIIPLESFMRNIIGGEHERNLRGVK